MRTTGEGAPPVSVVIPAMNAEAHLGEAIESVLEQSLPPFEVIVVDDGSTDATAEVAGSFGEPVRCLSQPWAGIGAALNRGIGEARGSLVAFLDADDLWLPEKQRVQVGALAEDTTLDMVFGRIRHFHSPELTVAERRRVALPPGDGPGVCKGAMLIRREALQRVGPFATQWRAGEFVEWYGRAVDAGLTGVVAPQVVISRRLHGGHSSPEKREGRQDYVRVLKATLDRRRAEGI